MVDILADKKGEDIVLMDITGVAPFTDYFVICSGTSERMLRSLAEALKSQLREDYRLSTNLEGAPRDGWVLADLGDVVVHLFAPDERAFYDLEELWSEGKVLLRLQ